jgi:hypothetical protein
MSSLLVELYRMLIKYETYSAAPVNMMLFEVRSPRNIMK